MNCKYIFDIADVGKQIDVYVFVMGSSITSRIPVWNCTLTPWCINLLNSSSSLESPWSGWVGPMIELVIVCYNWSGAAERHEQSIADHFQLQMVHILTWLQALADGSLLVIRSLRLPIEDISHPFGLIKTVENNSITQLNFFPLLLINLCWTVSDCWYQWSI